MYQSKKQQLNIQFRRSPNPTNKISKQQKTRIPNPHPKQTFLTDTQTSDYTKSQTQSTNPKIILLQKTIIKLQKENKDLKLKLIQIKKSQFYDINQQKLHSIFKQIDQLKLQLQSTRQQLQHISIQKDFLQRNNRIVKQECQKLTIQIMKLKNIQINTNKIQQKNKDYQSIQDNYYDTPKSARNQKIVQFLQWRRQKQQTSNSVKKNKLKKCISATKLNQDYNVLTYKNNKKY